MIKIVIALSFALCTLELKWDQINVHPSARGDLDLVQKSWNGGLYECDLQCKNAGGNSCGSGDRVCCQ